jgi:carbamoyl-phosphate synthase large subunit
MNVLITSAAAKVLLVQAFSKAVRRFDGKVFTADLEQVCAAGRFSDGHFKLRPIDGPGAIEEIEQICRDNAVRLIVPTRDGELSFFAHHKDRLQSRGVDVLVCGERALADCQNKRRFASRLRAAGLGVIPEIDPDDIVQWPVFVRPVTGSGGRGANRVDSRTGLPDNLETYLVHPLLTAREYSIDLLMDLYCGRPVQAVVRVRQNVVAGESKVSTVVAHPALESATMKLGAALNLVGHNTVQAFDDAARGIMFIEVNPRFGGASNCSIVAGLASPERILGMLAGDLTALESRPIQHGLKMLRYAQDVFVESSHDTA